VVLDTSFLISYASVARTNHVIARKYFDELIRTGVPMLLPTVVVAEFERRQSLATLGLGNFRILPFNFDDALEAANLAEAIRPSSDDRLCLAADVKIIAQAKLRGARAVLTEDAKTMAAYIDELRHAGKVTFHPILLAGGFDASLIQDPAAPELPLD
jgi:predicted nucleic acid-binding protein